MSLIAVRLGHADPVEAFRGYCAGLLLPVPHESVEPTAAQLARTKVRSEHERLHRSVAIAESDDAAAVAAVRDQVQTEVVPRTGLAEAPPIDATGFPK